MAALLRFKESASSVMAPCDGGRETEGNGEQQKGPIASTTPWPVLAKGWRLDPNEADACGWTGVTCNADQRVTGISFASNVTEAQRYAISGDIAELASCSELTTLDLSHTRAWGSLGSLGACTQLESIDLVRTRVDGRIEQLAPCRRLTHLDLYQDSFVEGDLDQLMRGCTRLQSLTLYGLPRITGRVDSVAAATRERLQYLRITSQHVTGDLQSLRVCSNLWHLTLGNTKVGGDIAALRSCTKLAVLHVGGSGAVQGSIEALGACPDLRDLRMGHTQVHGSIEALGACPDLQWLELPDTQVHGSIESLAQNTKLKKVYLRHTDVGGDTTGTCDRCTDFHVDACSQYACQGEGSTSIEPVAAMAGRTDAWCCVAPCATAAEYTPHVLA
eukprot:COSAG01_NODE_8926_length_2612_cov_1.803422_1_plen_387_part_10